MKNKRFISIAFFTMLITLSVSCKKEFLERPPLDQISFDNFYQSDADLRLATGVLYGSPWFDYNDKAYNAFGDAMSGNLARTNWVAYSTFAVSAEDSRSNEAWRSLYKIIAYCNLNIIYITQNSGPAVTVAGKNNALGELHFLRAIAYFHLVQLFGEVPIIVDNRTLADNPQVNKNLIKDVYRFIIEDLNFSVKNLGIAFDKGRVNKWAASGLLAKVYLTRAGLKDDGTGVNGLMNQALLDSAKFYAGDVCKNSGLSLVPNYSDLFLIANNNNLESLFAFQWINGNGNYGIGNSFQGYFAAESKITGVGDGFGGANTPSYDIYRKYQLGDTRRRATFMQSGDVYTEILKKEGGYKVTNTYPHVKKYVVGTPDDTDGKVSFLSTASNTYVLRLADVYLIYAEAIRGNNTTTSDADALLYFNKVRKRANPNATNLTALTKQSNVPNPDYSAIANNSPTLYKDDILEERQLEFAMEGQFWFDLLRLHNVSSTDAKTFIWGQDRGRFTYTSTNNAIVREPLYTLPTEDAFKLQYPAADVTLNPKLLEPAVPYYK